MAKFMKISLRKRRSSWFWIDATGRFFEISGILCLVLLFFYEIPWYWLILIAIVMAGMVISLFVRGIFALIIKIADFLS